MSKEIFINELRKKLKGLPKNVIDESIEYYEEIISDRLDDGEDIEHIIKTFDSTDIIANEIINNIPLTKLVKEKVTPKRKLKVIEIVLIILLSPIWLSLLCASLAIVLAVLGAIWSVFIAAIALTFALAGAALGILIGAIANFIGGKLLEGFALSAAAMILAGLAIMSGFMLKYIAKGILTTHKNFFIAIKKIFI